MTLRPAAWLALSLLALLAGCSAGGDTSTYSWGWYVINPLTDKGASNL
jgi:hypothetical protein